VRQGQLLAAQLACGRTAIVGDDFEPQLILIDHTTGETATLEGRPVQELASTLVEQARSVQTAAVGIPPSYDEPE
jgi:hypothetical protein